MAKKKDDKSIEVVQSLKVEINFNPIYDLQLPIGFDGDGNLIIGVRFKARVDQFEVARLVNLLKQPHGALYAVIGSTQSALDFKFDSKQLRFEIFKASKGMEEKKPAKVIEDKTAAQVEDATNQAVKIEIVRFNHIPEEKEPFGVFIEYSADGMAETHSAAGRGKNPTEAVISGVKNCGAVDASLNEPFEVRAALELLEPSTELFKLIRVLDVGSFDVDEGGEGPEGETEPEAEKE